MSDLPVTTATGLPANVAGALAYLLGPVSGVAFLVLEKHNGFVRFHAAQSIVVGAVAFILALGLSIVGGILGLVPIIGWLVGALLSLAFGAAAFLFWIVLMYRAYQGQEWEVPVASEYARRLSVSASV